MSMARIVTNHNPPPIPVRAFDWTATFDGYEPGAPVGYGPTEQDAIDDLQDTASDCECDLQLTLSELDSGRCAACGKAVFR